jgi:tRNA dimethylallyltransferase
MSPKNPKFITILGPTASGKTDLALSLAEAFEGEIVCADSRTIYTGMDIGTAKPTAAERARVPHHLLDVVEPGQTLTVAAFKRLAEAAIADIWARGRVPFLVGGSGLYLDAVLFDYQFAPQANPAARARLEALTTTQLQQLLATKDPAAYQTIDLANRRRVVRAIETAGQATGRRARVRPDTLVLGLSLNKEVIQKRIAKRAEFMLSKGLLAEVKRLGETYGWHSEAMSGVAYRAFKDVVLGTKTVEQATNELVRGDLRLVKKQLTWFKRNQAITWLDDPAKAASLVRQFLAG